jgi:hypothetical protein
MHARATVILALLLLLTGLGCSRPSQNEVGVVARVNGKPITLDLLEFQYDLQHFEALGGALPSVSSLREAYGEILGQLIAQELVAQELAVRGQDISEEELKKAEDQVRADYPDDTFEQMLADEYIDLDMWRRQLRYVLGVEKFQRLVLRPSIHLDYREVEQYYQNHLDAFRLPERLRVLVVRAPDRAQVERAIVAYRQSRDVSALANGDAGLQAMEVTVPVALLTPAWADALHGGDKNRQGAILPGRAGFEGLLLLERLPAQTVDIAKAYAQVEATLIEERMQQAFAAWVSKAAEAAVIRVSSHLLHKQEDEDLPPEAPAENMDQQTVASGNETG